MAFKCNFCEKSFDKKASYNKHQRIDHKNIILKCELCDKTFSRKSGVQVHKRLVHGKLQKFKCNICENCFGDSHQLKIHIEAIHFEKSDLKECDICKKVLEMSKPIKEKFIRKGVSNVKLVIKNYLARKLYNGTLILCI